MTLRWNIKTNDPEPDKPKFPTSDFAHDMAKALAESRKKKKKGRKDERMANGVSLEV